MSMQNLGLVRNLIKNKFNNVIQPLRTFSRKSNNTEEPYKVINSRRTVKDEKKLASRDPNFELLASTTGFPFILPGNVGLAWYDKDTSLQTQHEFIMEQIEPNNEMDGSIICRVQSCPTVLRQTVSDLFPYRNLQTCELSVVTISLKSDIKLMRKNKEIETERMAQNFVIVAKIVCDKLRKVGYWADFINPFSGRPYLVPTSSNELYEADEKFRCLDFQIFDIKDCKIISNEQDSSLKRFTGSLFTNAPSKKNHLNNVFSQSNQ